MTKQTSVPIREPSPDCFVSGNNTVGIREVFDIACILAPQELICVPEEEICEVIKEAFIAYAHRDSAYVLSVEFPDMPGVTYCSWGSIWR